MIYIDFSFEKISTISFEKSGRPEPDSKESKSEKVKTQPEIHPNTKHLNSIQPETKKNCHNPNASRAGSVRVKSGHAIQFNSLAAVEKYCVILDTIMKNFLKHLIRLLETFLMVEKSVGL